MKFLTFSKVYFIICGLLFTVFSARILGIEKYGDTVFIIGLLYTFDFIFSGKNEINVLISNDQATDLLNSIIKGSFILCFFIFIISLIFSYFFRFNFFIFPFISLFSGLQAILQMDINKNYDLKYIGLNNLLVGTFTISIGSLLVYFFNETGYYYSILTSLFLSVVFYSSKSEISLKNIYSSKPLYFWNNKLENIISSFSLTSLGDILPIFIKIYFDSYILGIYMLSVKFIKTGLFFIANLLGNYFVKMNFKLKLFPRYIFLSLSLYFTLMLVYGYCYKTSFFNEFVKIFIGDDSSSFIEYSLFFLSIFLLDSIVVAISSFLIRFSVNALTLVRVFHLSSFLFILLFDKLSIGLVSSVLSVNMIISLLFFSFYIKKNQR